MLKRISQKFTNSRIDPRWRLQWSCFSDASLPKSSLGSARVYDQKESTANHRLGSRSSSETTRVIFTLRNAEDKYTSWYYSPLDERICLCLPLKVSGPTECLGPAWSILDFCLLLFFYIFVDYEGWKTGGTAHWRGGLQAFIENFVPNSPPTSTCGRKDAWHTRSSKEMCTQEVRRRSLDVLTDAHEPDWWLKRPLGTAEVLIVVVVSRRNQKLLT